ncbi:MAG: 2Fe-2S iron-sulfur cluster-binding protein, partial [bacterium]|nr:2Fe-2S iron-sulfur cluster-binding protein [bacterium]
MSDEQFLIIFQPKKKSVKVAAGTKLIDAAEKAGSIIPNVCGGRGKCGKCKIQILEPEIPFSFQEEILLSPEERAIGIHLACEVRVTENLMVKIVTEEDLATTRFLTYDLANEFEIDNHIKKIYLRLKKPDISDQIDDLHNLESSGIFAQSNIFTPLAALQNLSTFLRKNDFAATFVVEKDQIISMEANDTTDRLYGVAFDLGTTTIVGSLVDLLSGKVLQISARTNPQSKRGADVISRINYAMSEPGGLVKLQSSVIETINEIVEELCRNANVNFREIYEMSLAGNTIMNHLFLGVTPQYIAEAPYIPAFRSAQRFMAEELGITIQPRGGVTTLPNISGYVGGDITGFILASEIHKSEHIILGIDVGTNGEIILG